MENTLYGKLWNNMSPFEFWNEIENPKYVCGPMVDQSELSFRTLVRKYGTDLTFTPMIHSVIFSDSPKNRQKWLDDISIEEQPCFVQFCGHDPEILLNAAKYVESKTPCVDLNLGCPQAIAKRGRYGAYLLEHEDEVLKIVGYLSNNLKCAVSCKIRLFPNFTRTLQLVQNLEHAGIKVLTVHGRTKEQNKNPNQSDWQAIRKIKESVNIPVIANGGVECYEDIQKCFDTTKCDAVMSAEKLLEAPFLFSGKMYDIDEVALEFLDICKKIDSDVSFSRSHLYKFYYQACKLDGSFNSKIGESKTFDQLIQVGNEIKEFRKKLNILNEDKFGWYLRYRKKNSLISEVNLHNGDT